MLFALIIWAALTAWMWNCCGPRVAVPWFALACVLFVYLPTAYADVNNPTKFDGIHVVHRCPKVSNPIECTSLGDNDTQNDTSYPRASGHHIPGVDRCTLNRDIYEYHHGLTGKPHSLRGYTGCKLYAIDSAYHRAAAKLGMLDTLQEAAERALSIMGVAPSDLGHVALTATPQ